MLQAFAIQHALNAMGHDALHLHIRPECTLVSKYHRLKATNLRSFLVKAAVFLTRKKIDKRFESFEEFLANEIATTRRYRSQEEVDTDPPDFDAYVCGSDQIWNLENGVMHFFYAKYVPRDSPVISYAPSFGNPILPEGLRNEVKELLSRFRHLSVREACGCRLVEELTARKVTKVIDPAFLVENEVWQNLEVAPRVKGKYIAFYSLESSKRTSRILVRLARETKLPIVILGKAGTFALRTKTVLAIESGPREFLGYIRNAALVVTNSFHATAFALKFGVPMITISHSTRNSRMEDLLGSASLKDRIIHNEEDLHSKPDGWIFESPGRESLSEIELQIERSRQFLRSSLADLQAI